MKLTKTIACAAATLLMPALAWAAPAPSHDHGASGRSQPTQAEATAKPQEMKCPMMQGMHGKMKMGGQAMTHDQDSAQHSATGDSSGMAGMKCMHHETAASPATAPQKQHDHDHAVAGKPQ